MNRFIFIAGLFCLFNTQVLPQTINCSLPQALRTSLNQQQVNGSVSLLTSPTSINEVIIVAKDFGSTSDLPPWFDPTIAELPSWFSQATFGNYTYSSTVIKNNGGAFIMPTAYDPVTQENLSDQCGENGHVFKRSNILAVLQQADLNNNFAPYADINNIVKIHFVCVNGNANRGTVCSFDYTSNDLKNGSPVILRVGNETRGINQKNFYGVFCHEAGHRYFNMPDMDHSNNIYYDHWSLGSFEVMSNLGFGDRPSLYNPVFRSERSWVTPTVISSSQSNVTLNDFQTGATKCYVFNSNPNMGGLLNVNSLGQKLYITYHNPQNGANVFYNDWPFRNRNKGGIFIWHATSGGDYADYRRMPADIEFATGKFNWQINSTTPYSATNLGVANPYTGRDSLEVRIINSGNVVGGPYFNSNKGVGSAATSYTPDEGKTFTPFSNPNSNWYSANTTDYAQTGISDLSVTNIRSNAGSVLVDFGISSNYTVSQNTVFGPYSWSFDTDVTVNSGVNLTIQSGATLYFTPGKRLIVYGTLNATNTTFTSSQNWSGIVFQSGSSGTIDGCTVNNVQTYGGAAITLNACSPTIQNSTIEPRDGSHGIAILSSTTPYIYNNTIRMYGTSSHGIYTSQSNPYIRKNYIIGKHNSNSAGIFAENISSPLLGVPSSSTEGKNNIINFYNGLYVSYYSTMYGGAVDRARDNLIYLNDYSNVYASYNSTVYARYNYWGQYPPAQNKFMAYNNSFIYWDPALPSPPSLGLVTFDNGGNNIRVTGENILAEGSNSSSIMNHVIFNNSESVLNNDIHEVTNGKSFSIVADNNFSSSDEDLLWDGIELRLNKKFDDAIKIYKSILNLSSNPNTKKKALIEITYTCIESKSPDLTNLVESYTQKKDDEDLINPLALELLSRIHIYNNEHDKALEVNMKIINDYPKSIFEKHGFLNLFFIYYNKGKYEPALSALLNVAMNDTNDCELMLAKNLLEIIGKNISTSSFAKENSDVMKNICLSKKDNTDFLLSNYPNPFNPTTTINFQIPEDSYVTLKVYDVLGREVASLVNEERKAGRYICNFDASKLASGVYIYKITANNFVQSKKMLLMK